MHSTNLLDLSLKLFFVCKKKVQERIAKENRDSVSTKL